MIFSSLNNKQQVRTIILITIAIIGVLVLFGIGLVIYKSVSVQSTEIALNPKISLDRAVVKIRCNVEGPEFVWGGLEFL